MVQRAMPPGMLQQMRSGGGIQDMMKAMMGPNVSDEEMAEMQRKIFTFIMFCSICIQVRSFRYDGRYGYGTRRYARSRLVDEEYGWPRRHGRHGGYGTRPIVFFLFSYGIHDD